MKKKTALITGATRTRLKAADQLLKIESKQKYCETTGYTFWKRDDKKLNQFAQKELISTGTAKKDSFIDSAAQRFEKAFSAYSGTYNQIDLIKKFVNKFDNLFLAGRNGMHRYNNQDYSNQIMLTAMAAVDNIINNTTYKTNIWNVNSENSYNEEKADK